MVQPLDKDRPFGQVDHRTRAEHPDDLTQATLVWHVVARSVQELAIRVRDLQHRCVLDVAHGAAGSEMLILWITRQQVRQNDSIDR
jgi:hypothetical protein